MTTTLAKVIVPTDEAYVWAIRKMYDRGEISLEQYSDCLRRYSEISKR